MRVRGWQGEMSKTTRPLTKLLTRTMKTASTSSSTFRLPECKGRMDGWRIFLTCSDMKDRHRNGALYEGNCMKWGCYHVCCYSCYHGNNQKEKKNALVADYWLLTANVRRSRTFTGLLWTWRRDHRLLLSSGETGATVGWLWVGLMFEQHLIIER